MRSESNRRGWPCITLLAIVLALHAGHFVPSGTFAGSQEQGSGAPRNQARRPLKRPSLDDRVSQFARNLNLSESQRSSVKTILEQRQQQILRIRQDASISGSDRISKLRALQVDTVAQIRAILNEEQRQKYNPLAPREIPRTPQPSVEDWIKAVTPR
jgi:DnaJ-domain-containing protein 1